jgi:hypothetical protein
VTDLAFPESLPEFQKLFPDDAPFSGSEATRRDRPTPGSTPESGSTRARRGRSDLQVVVMVREPYKHGKNHQEAMRLYLDSWVASRIEDALKLLTRGTAEEERSL